MILHEKFFTNVKYLIDLHKITVFTLQVEVGNGKSRFGK